MVIKLKVIDVHAMKALSHKSNNRFHSNENYNNLLIKRAAM